MEFKQNNWIMKKFHERWLESVDELEESYEIQTRKVFRRTALQFTASLLKEKMKDMTPKTLEIDCIKITHFWKDES